MLDQPTPADLTPIANAINKMAATMEKGPWDYVNYFAVLATLGVLIWYTFETWKLRRAAQKQTEKTENLLTEAQKQNTVSANLLREAQRQNEAAVMPMLAVIDEYFTDGSNRHGLVIRNVGPGPAFNVSADSVQSDHGKLGLNFRGNVQMPGEIVPFTVMHHTEPEIATNLGLRNFYEEIRSGQLPNPLTIVLRCFSITSVHYSFAYKFTPQLGELIVTFEGFKAASRGMPNAWLGYE